MNQHREVQMKQSNNQVGEKVLVLGAGQLGASVLASLVPAVTQRNGSVCVIVSGRSRDKQSKRRSSIHQQLADAGARFIPVDIADSSVAALKRSNSHGFDTIINCMGFVAGAG
ncbi:2'-hydroxyisoflavone reductase, partial [Salmonella enterica subsp. enterica serovar Newport str. S09097]